MIEVPFGAAIALAILLLIAGALVGYRLSWLDAYDKAIKDLELGRRWFDAHHGAAVSTWPAPQGGSARIIASHTGINRVPPVVAADGEHLLRGWDGSPEN